MPEVAPRIRRLGEEIVNSYLVEDGGELVVIDAGLPGYWQNLETEARALGRSLADIRAVVLTHGHSDHIGFAARADGAGIKVLVHEADAALARGEVPNPARGFGPMRLAPLLGFLVFTARRGGLRIPKLEHVATFGDGATLDLPGSPVVTLVPGHTPGSAALHFPGHDALFVGDAMATYAVTSGKTGPQVAPFTADPDQAVESLRRIEHLPATVVLPGHGPAWHQGVASAVAAVRAPA